MNKPIVDEMDAESRDDPRLAQALDAAPWMREARSLLDPDARANGTDGRRTVRAAERLDRALPLLGAPWCGLFVAHCLRVARPDLDLPTVQPQGRSWRDLGAEIAPQIGAVLVFWMLARWSGLGHVGFYWAEDATHFHVLGGNQRDRVEIQRWPKKRLLRARWPDADASPPGLRRRARPGDARGFEFGEVF